MPFPSATVQSPADHPIPTSAAAYAYGRGRSTESFVRRAVYVFLDNGLIVPAQDHLESIVRLARQAQELFFAGATFHPDESQLDHFFLQFIRLSAVPTPRPLPQLYL
jgi:hypothetical protein